MTSNNKYKAIIFDLFGTLVGTFSSQAHDQVLNEMALILGVQGTAFIKLFDDDMRSGREVGQYGSIEENIMHACKILGVHPISNALRKAARLRYEFMEQSLYPRKDAIKIINQLKSEGYLIGLISDCSPEVPILWPTTPFADLIDIPLFSCKVGVKKPNQRIYQLLCRKLNVFPNECLYIGDGDSSELEGAEEIGMHPILIRVQGETDLDRDRPSANSWGGRRVTGLSEIMHYV